MARRSESVQLRRQWALLRLLSASGRWFTVKELAEQLGVSKSTIERDLTTLEAVFPLAEERAGKQKRRYRIDLRIRQLDAMQPFGAMQLAALGAALQVLRPLAGTGLYEDLQAVAQTVRAALAERHNGGIDRLASVFLPHTRGFVPYADHAETIDAAVDAVVQRRECTVTYRRAGADQAADHIVHPLKLLWHDGAIYLLCRFASRGCVGKLAVHRIERLEPTGGRFPAPRADLDAIVRRAFGIYDDDSEAEEVEIRFAAEVAFLIEERVFHPDEEKARLPDGTLRYRIRTTAKREIVRWVLSFGGDAELVAPARWRGELAEQARALLDCHRAA